MRLFRHFCLNGEIWDWAVPMDTLLDKELPKTCPHKEDCGRRWEEIDLSMYPGGSPFEFVVIHEEPDEPK